MSILIVVGILVILIIWVFGIYNSLVRLRNQVKNGWSQIDVQLKRRHDLIPNLVETAKGYMKHERETLDSVTKARSQAVDASGVANQAKAEGELSGDSRFMLVVENYPDLKASRNFLTLQDQIEGTENQIAIERRNYNEYGRRYNTRLQTFPSNMVLATMLEGKVCSHVL